MRAAILIGILFTAGVAHADDATVEAAAPSPAPPWQVHAFSLTRFSTQGSMVTLAEEPLRGGGATFEGRLTTVTLPGPFAALDLSAELGMDGSSTSGTTFQQLSSDISTWEITAGGRARLPIFRWLHVSGAAQIGGGRTHVAIRDMATSSGIANVDTTFGARAALGVSLMPRVSKPNAHAVFLGLDLEVGYQVSTAVPVRATPEDRPAPELTIPAAYASLGDLELDGWTLRIGTAIGF